MRKLWRILCYLRQIEQLERRLAIVEGELVLRVAKLEADAALIEASKARARRLFEREPKAKSTDKRFEWVLETLTEPMWASRLFAEKSSARSSGLDHLQQLQNLQDSQAKR